MRGHTSTTTPSLKIPFQLKEAKIAMSSHLGTRRKGARRELKLSLPQDLVDKLDLVCMDTGKGRPVFGERSRVIESLLRPWVEARFAEIRPASASQLLANEAA